MQSCAESRTCGRGFNMTAVAVLTLWLQLDVLRTRASRDMRLRVCDWSRLRWRRRTMVHDEARAARAGEISPYPLKEDAHAHAGEGEEFNVNKGPRQPREVAAQFEWTGLDNRKALADDCHVAFVEVAEGRRRGFVD